jgi:molecular chaperone HtpG
VAAEKAELEVPEPAAAEGQLTPEQATGLAEWLKATMADAVAEVRVSKRLAASPVIAVDSDGFMTATMRRTLKAMNRDQKDQPASSPDLEINPRHPLVSRLEGMRHKDPDLAAQAAAQILDNARMAAGLVEDPRPMIQRMNQLLERVLT